MREITFPAGLAGKVREKIESLKIKHSGSEISEYVTISLGVASMTPGDDGVPDVLVSAADRALYEAKAEGRNRIKISEL
ncbi:MAG: diguanylate cyclase [Thermodesulfobacteriota bacterium]